MKILILGGGPAGLGAAWRLNELGHEDWTICEASDHWGGLSASFTDDHGFVWDFGGHVLFSHYSYFDKVMDSIFDDSGAWLTHNREAWIWMQDRFVPYPLQNNIHRLPEAVYWECLEGIIDIQNRKDASCPAHFGQWIMETFGKGLAKWFLNPYNYKVWAYPPDQMGWSWVGERVAPVNLKQILKNAVFQNNETPWGPNARFRFPARGGTGAIWNRVASQLPQSKACLNKRAVSVDAAGQKVRFADGSVESYDLLMNTLPLTDFLGISDGGEATFGTCKLLYSSTHVVGLALKGNPPDHLRSKCWIYFPENNCPFYRVTVFSNYSPNNVPDIDCQWSLMCEVSESPVKKLNHDGVVQDVIQGALNTGLIRDRSEIDHTWYQFEAKGYPVPSLNRDPVVVPALKRLEQSKIFSRGRFGGWKYEVGNMDHSFMQGVELVDTLLCGAEEVTIWCPGMVNSGHFQDPKRP